MSNPTHDVSTLALFGLDGEQPVFACGTCQALSVSEPGQLCPACTPDQPVKAKPRARRTRATRSAPKRDRGERP